jgi:hypothetical protein
MWSNLNQSVKSDGSLDITKNPPSWYFIGGVWNRLDFIYDDAWVIKYPALNGQPDAGSIGQVLTSSGNINNNPTWSTIKQSIGTSISTYTDVTTGTENKIGLKYNFGANVTPDSSSELNLVPCYKSSYEAWKTGDKLNNHTLYFVVPDITTS